MDGMGHSGNVHTRFYSKSRNTFKFSNVFWLQRSHTSSDFLRSQLMFSSWSPFPIYIRMLDPIISKFHPEGVIHVNLVSSPKKILWFPPSLCQKKKRVNLGRQNYREEIRIRSWGANRILHTTQLFFLNSRRGDQLGRDPKEWRWDEPRSLMERCWSRVRRDPGTKGLGTKLVEFSKANI